MNPNSRPTQFVAESDSQPAQKRKARRNFDEDRRNEVREIRKIGACERCRILKKPCSLGTPCRTCAAVGDPRIWKEQCIRTKKLPKK